MDYTIYLKSIEDIQDFIQSTNNFTSDFDLFSGRYIVDGKSIMGVLSLDLSKPIHVKVHVKNDESNEIQNVMNKYTV